jgi:hypothetical protein
MATPTDLMLGIIARVERVDRLTLALFGEPDKRVFGSLPSSGIPTLTPAELGFIRSASWLYMAYHEIGAASLRFLIGLMGAYRLDAERSAAHYASVREMRTFLQHNLTLSPSGSPRAQSVCEDWLASKCGSAVPALDGEWLQCLEALLGDAVAFLAVVEACVRAIEADDARDSVLRDWGRARMRHHPPEQFDGLVEQVAGDLGIDAVDAPALRKRYYDRWVKHLRALTEYSFDIEARKLIEHALLREVTKLPPITGHDIIDLLGIPPGPKVGDALRQAYALYDADPSCSRDELLARLRASLPREVAADMGAPT